MPEPNILFLMTDQQQASTVEPSSPCLSGACRSCGKPTHLLNGSAIPGGLLDRSSSGSGT